MNNQEIVKIVVDELEKRGYIKNDSISFKNTEKLLYSYNSLKNSIKNRKIQIKDLEIEGIPNKSKDILVFKGKGSSGRNNNDPIEEAINSVNKSIIITEAMLKHIDRIISQLSSDPYYDIIKLKYFENKGYEEIAEYIDKKHKKESGTTAVSTISKNKNRLIDKVRIALIPNAYINELMR